jgi:UTP--glucose-1-phosphate uridylyltransferase
MLGLGHAILTGEPLVGNEPFAVILSDDLCVCDEDDVTSQLIEIYNKYQCSVIAIEEIPLTEIENYGVIFGDLIDGTNDTYQVTNMIEKPNSDDLIKFVEDKVDLNKAPTFMAIIGRYILTPDIFHILRNVKSDNHSEIQITDALLSQSKQGKVIAYKFKGKRFDCGSVKGYLKASNYLAKLHGIS